MLPHSHPIIRTNFFVFFLYPYPHILKKKQIRPEGMRREHSPCLSVWEREGCGNIPHTNVLANEEASYVREEIVMRPFLSTFFFYCQL